MIVLSVLMLVLGFFGLVTGIVLLCIKRTRKAGLITTLSSVLVGIIFTIVLAVGGYNVVKDDVSERTTNNSVSQEDSYSDDSEDDYSDESSDTDETESLSIGDSESFSNEDDGTSVDVKIKEAQKVTPSAEDESTGKYFIKATVEFKNTGTETYMANAAEFSIYDGNDEKGEVSSKDFIAEEVAPGKSYTGNIYFDVKNDGPYEIHLYNSSWTWTGEHK
ncbi:DUF4352 domain-containing protein [Listeria monocytogenes]|nr:DUF4352 domain-containing protein [Listeria monocytogenes]EAE9987004.1 DUF4352 domain-containing protein [Listeria monocytogenes]EAE9990729.1 DUF4352 domain-containing protein [Listeria monocytogenes]EAE9993767.1 DUF4352 domain-containing protein [Listeria monocytogenes]EAE9995935.1 DUF4352 domain-containing protein [Listeria monocytogenes]